MSLQKTSLPALLMFAGGWIDTAGAAVVVVAGGAVVAAFLPPPQPTVRRTARAVAASPAIAVFGRCIVLPFRRFEPDISGRQAERCYRLRSYPSPRYVFRTCSFSRRLLASSVSTTRPVSST